MTENEKKIERLYSIMEDLKKRRRQEDASTIKWAIFQLEAMDRQRTNAIDGQSPGLQLFTVRDCMKILKVTQRTIYNYLDSGQLKAIKTGREWKISEDNLREFMSKGTPKE